MTEKNHSKQSATGKTQLNELNILSLNVCGLTSKMKCPEFIDLLNQCDLLGLQETKLMMLTHILTYLGIKCSFIIEVVFPDIGQGALFL